MAHRMGLDKARVVEEAAKLVDEEGLEQLSLGRLAQRLGVRTPSLYNHVAGLPGLQRDLALYCAKELRDIIMRATIGKARAEAIFAFADVYRAYARQDPGRYALTLAPDPDYEEIQALTREVLEIAQAVLAPYKLNEHDAIHAIRSLRSIVQGFISLEMAGGFKMSYDLDASFHWLLNLFIAGLERSI
ncbi:TetR/AcrR family transcriptional regulator [Ktedonobacter robiniae]|uniref:TetR family transcriptional regulator n=1 Tax=Ktedonobacter robiniae TaxID=2778365 RepID=A0ABQ3V0J8_9CHLR|nr:TetR-like C-terminal domain-containing protein [Ktedonobacter robiniae]GHO58486.1 TetR family transcriptional regulator [Ktedonobacter robiniae]